METITFVALILVGVASSVLLLMIVILGIMKKTANSRAWVKGIVFFAKLLVVLLVLTIVLEGRSMLTKEASQREHDDTTTIEHFLSGEAIALPDINGVIGSALHPQIKIWTRKHFPPEKQEEAYRAMLEEIFNKKVKLEIPASIAPYFTPLPASPNDNKSDDAPPPK